MNSRKRKAINNLAYNIREVLKLQTPIDLSTLVNELEGKIEYSSDIDGKEARIQKLDIGEKKFLVTLPETTTHVRDRFTIAHELGHLFLHMGYLIDDEKWASTGIYKDSAYYRFGHTEEEYEANEFAGALLMPEKEFTETANKFKQNNTYDLDKIAEHFNVSTDAAKVRGRWLGIFSWE